MIRSLKLHDVLTADVLQHALYIMSVSAAATREKAAAIQLVSIMMDLSDVAIHFQDCAVRGCECDWQGFLPGPPLLIHTFPTDARRKVHPHLITRR